MSPKSGAEEELWFQLTGVGLLLPEREYRFHPVRRWRFDFAWPSILLAVEIEGGVWVRGRHTRGAGFIKDCLKYNTAVLLGWRVLRLPADLIHDGSGLTIVLDALRIFGAPDQGDPH